MLLIYSLCFFLFLLDTYLFQEIFSEYGSIEPEYRPVEQATRLAYLFVAVIDFSLLYLVNQSPYKPSLDSFGIFFKYFPVSMPKPSGEYASRPIFSLCDISASPTSYILF